MQFETAPLWINTSKGLRGPLNGVVTSQCWAVSWRSWWVGPFFGLQASACARIHAPLQHLTSLQRRFQDAREWDLTPGVCSPANSRPTACLRSWRPLAASRHSALAEAQVSPRVQLHGPSLFGRIKPPLSTRKMIAWYGLIWDDAQIIA